MVTLQIPCFAEVILDHLVPDCRGTLAKNGVLGSGVRRLMPNVVATRSKDGSDATGMAVRRLPTRNVIDSVLSASMRVINSRIAASLRAPSIASQPRALANDACPEDEVFAPHSNPMPSW
jgi:hypothetical protein